MKCPRELSEELGHHDGGRAVHRFIRNPDDGHGPIGRLPLFGRLWRLTPEQAERIRRRFS